MASSEKEPILLSNDEAMQNIRQRVQKKIAGQYLEVLSPELMNRDTPDHKKLQENMDPKTRAKFEEQYGKYRTKPSSLSVQNILWFIGSIGLFYYLDFYVAVRYDPRVNRPWFYAGLLLISVNVAIALFFIVWLSCVKKIKSDDWEHEYPSLIPIATAACLLGGICLTIGLWPIWNFFTPFILFTFFMGFVVTIVMLPSFGS